MMNKCSLSSNINFKFGFDIDMDIIGKTRAKEHYKVSSALSNNASITQIGFLNQILLSFY